MSIKAYGWYKIKRKGDFWPLVEWIEHKGKQKVAATLREVALKLAPGVGLDSEPFKEALRKVWDTDNLTEQQRIDLARLDVIFKMMREGYKESTTSPYRDLFNFDVWVRFLHHRGRVYVNAHADMWMEKAVEFVGFDRRLEDVSYWNNTDRPKDVTERTWRKRKKIWESLGDTMSPMVTVSLCDWSSFTSVMPYFAMSREIREGTLVLPAVKTNDDETKENADGIG